MDSYLKEKEKEMRLARLQRSQEFERQQLLEKIEEDNKRSEQIRREREELMRNREQLRQQIERDKQRILNDFEEMKQGKLKPEQIADKYGYEFKNKDNQGSMNKSGISRASKKSKGYNRSRLSKRRHLILRQQRHRPFRPELQEEHLQP